MRTRVEAFMFRLVRDNVPAGIIEEQVRVVETAHTASEALAYQGEATEFLGDWAKHMSKRLVPDPIPVTFAPTASETAVLMKIKMLLAAPYMTPLDAMSQQRQESNKLRQIQVIMRDLL